MSTQASLAAGVPTPRVGPNLINPPSLYPQILATVVLCSSLTTFFVFARSFTRWKQSCWFLEDYLLVLAWAFNLAYDFAFLALGRSGMGRHIWDVGLQDLNRIAKFEWAIVILYCPATWLAKAALLVQLIRIFAPTKTGPIHKALHVLIWTNLVFYFSQLFWVIFQCVPQDKIWHPERPGGRCINFGAAALATGSVNVISDALILLLPLVSIWRLHMSSKRKIGVSAVFATGLLTLASSICRLVYSTKFLHDEDTTYISAEAGMWTLAELATINLITCFPVMPRFAELVLSRFRHSDKGIKGSSYLKASSKVPRYIGSQSRSHLTDSSEAWIKRGEDVTAPRSAYIRLAEEQGSKRLAHGQGGIQRTVSIELTSEV